LGRAAAAWLAFASLGLAANPLFTMAQLDCGKPSRFGREDLYDRVRLGLDHGAWDLLPLFIEDLGHPQLFSDNADHDCYSTLISTSTPAGRSSLVNASTVCALESRMSIRRLWVLSSNCSRDF